MHEFKQTTFFKFIAIFCGCYLTYFILNFHYLRTWSLSGDDLYSLTNSIASIQILITKLFTEFTGQYRHITYYLFHFYKLLLPNFLIIFLVHGTFLSLIPTILFFILKEKINTKFNIIITACFFLSPIFYYHTYTISSLANVLMSIITLIFIYYYEHRHKYNTWRDSIFFLLLVFIAMAIKETFIVPLSIYCLVQIIHITKKNRFSFLFLSLAVGAFLAYLSIRIVGYSNNTPQDYYFVFNFRHTLENILHIIAWLMNYPKGWQYGAPLRYHFWQPLISAINFCIFLLIFIVGLMKKKSIIIIYGLFIMASVILFIFLNHIHLFYMDLPFLLLLILGVKIIQITQKTRPTLTRLIIIIFFATNLWNLKFIKPQWLQHSFVAKANQAAQNYLNILNTHNYQKYNTICIANHQRGSFGTEQGNLINHISRNNFEIYSIKNTELPEECFKDTSLILINDAWSYSIYKKIKHPRK